MFLKLVFRDVSRGLSSFLFVKVYVWVLDGYRVSAGLPSNHIRLLKSRAVILRARAVQRSSGTKG